eukprot:GHVR01111616.1.p1 GENE.GHVR01111616.1~~GHVR01111616.1.p1  ORF type:complete len:212 (+),score=45.36 GHVR01111616.1:411-1046(+)
MSRSLDQLKSGGHVLREKELTHTCSDYLKDNNNKIYYPCGLAAMSVFNDTFILKDKNNKIINLNTSIGAIGHESDITEKYVNYIFNEEERQEVNPWLESSGLYPGGISNVHFINWMRLSPAPFFRKLWARIDEPLNLPIQITVTNRYPVNSFGGVKSVTLVHTGPMGGRNIVLGIFYVITGSLLVLVGILLFLYMRKNPRHIGDISDLWFG